MEALASVVALDLGFGPGLGIESITKQSHGDQKKKKKKRERKKERKERVINKTVGFTIHKHGKGKGGLSVILDLID